MQKESERERSSIQLARDSNAADKSENQIFSVGECCKCKATLCYDHEEWMCFVSVECVECGHC